MPKVGPLTSLYEIRKGPLLYDVRKYCWDLGPPRPKLGLIYSAKSSQPPHVNLCLGHIPYPSSADIINASPLIQFPGREPEGGAPNDRDGGRRRRPEAQVAL